MYKRLTGLFCVVVITPPAQDLRQLFSANIAQRAQTVASNAESSAKAELGPANSQHLQHPQDDNPATSSAIYLKIHQDRAVSAPPDLVVFINTGGVVRKCPGLTVLFKHRLERLIDRCDNSRQEERLEDHSFAHNLVMQIPKGQTLFEAKCMMAEENLDKQEIDVDKLRACSGGESMIIDQANSIAD